MKLWATQNACKSGDVACTVHRPIHGCVCHKPLQTCNMYMYSNLKFLHILSWTQTVLFWLIFMCVTHTQFFILATFFLGSNKWTCMAVRWIGSQKRCIAQRQKSSAHIPRQNTSWFVEYFAVYPKIFVAVHHLFFKYREDPKVAQGCGTWCKQDVHRVLYYLVVAINTTCNNALGFQAF